MRLLYMPSSTCIAVKPHVILLMMCYCSYAVDSWHRAIDARKLNCCGWVLDCINNDIPLAHFGVVHNAHASACACGHHQSVKFSEFNSCLHGVLVAQVCHNDSIAISGLYCFLFLWMICQFWQIMDKLICILMTLSYTVVMKCSEWSSIWSLPSTRLHGCNLIDWCFRV